MNFWSNRSPLQKILIVIFLIGGIALGVKYSKFGKDLDNKKIFEPPKSDVVKKYENEGKLVLRVSVNSWPGFAGAVSYNGGFKASENSRYFKNFGMLVEFVLQDDISAGRSAWLSDDIDVLWGTFDALPTETGGWKKESPQFITQVDWSRGGDLIIGTSAVENINDLRGKKISVAFFTPSHSLLIFALESAGINLNEVELIQVADGLKSSEMFKSGAVDVAVLWAPDDKDCMDQVKGSHVLLSTATASNIISDGFFVKQKFWEAHQKEVINFVEGVLVGNAEIMNSTQAKDKAANYLFEATNIPLKFWEETIPNAKLATIGDNLGFFGFDDTYTGIKGEDLYLKMCKTYSSLNAAKDPISWREMTKAIPTIFNTLKNKLDPKRKENSIEEPKKFSTPTESVVNQKPISTKKLTVNFASGSDVLDEKAKSIIRRDFVPFAKSFANARIRIEGNTDDQGKPGFNKQLSLRRAKSIARFLIEEYGYDENRFICIGNGPDNPVSDNDTEEGRQKNRRSDFNLLEN